MFFLRRELVALHSDYKIIKDYQTLCTPLNEKCFLLIHITLATFFLLVNSAGHKQNDFVPIAQP